MATVASPALVCTKGEDRAYTFTHVNSGTDSTPVNITAWTISITIQRVPDSAAVLTKTGTVTNGSAGTYTWSLAQADTLKLVAGSYTFAVWRTDSGSATLMAEGTVTVNTALLY